MSQKIADHEVLARYCDALLARFPDQLQRLILFGSQARGDAIAESDIDAKDPCPFYLELRSKS